MKIIKKSLNNKDYYIHTWRYNIEKAILSPTPLIPLENPDTGNIQEWGDTGYNDLNKKILNKWNCQYFAQLTEEGKENLIQEVLSIYRKRNIFIGTYYYKHKDIIDEIRYCKKKDIPSFNGMVLDKRPTLGNALLKFLFPNFFLIDCKGVKDNNMYSRFYNDHKLYRSIEYCFKFKQKIKEPLISYSLLMGMQLIGGNTGTNYLPMKVRMLLEYYMPKGGNFLDFSCGFGSRLLGSQCSNVEGNINYFGFEPCAETYYHLNELKDYIYEAFNIQNDSKRVNLYEQGSEENLPEELKENIDFCFSCPPYFNLEDYTNSTDDNNDDRKKQCYNKYPTLEEWKEGYVRKTIQNIYKALKKDSYYAVNIADFKVNNEQVKFVDDWIEISKQEGFELIREIPTKLGRARSNTNTIAKSYIPKDEAIYLFKKISK